MNPIPYVDWGKLTWQACKSMSHDNDYISSQAVTQLKAFFFDLPNTTKSLFSKHKKANKMNTVVGLDKNGNECNPEELTSVAKKSYDESLKTERFWIKICNNGINSGRFFDPASNLEEELKICLENEDYERAAKLRDKINSVK